VLEVRKGVALKIRGLFAREGTSFTLPRQKLKFDNVKSTNDAFVSTFSSTFHLTPSRDPPQVINSAGSKRLAHNAAPKIHVRFPFPVKILGQ
jgi:hypothetical protein